MSRTAAVDRSTACFRFFFFFFSTVPLLSTCLAGGSSAGITASSEDRTW